MDEYCQPGFDYINLYCYNPFKNQPIVHDKDLHRN